MSREVKKAYKPLICYWCGQRIKTGHDYYPGYREGKVCHALCGDFAARSHHIRTPREFRAAIEHRYTWRPEHVDWATAIRSIFENEQQYTWQPAKVEWCNDAAGVDGSDDSIL